MGLTAILPIIRMQLFTLTRLNADSSWLLKFGESTLLIDPWLEGVQVDGYTWFSAQEHVMPCISVGMLPPLTAILVSHPFTDHCHVQTLAKLPASTPIMATPMAISKIEKMHHFTWPALIQNGFVKKSHVAVLPFEVSFWPAARKLDLTHNAIVIRCIDTRSGSTVLGPSILYAPHGILPEQAREIRSALGYAPDIVITTFTEYRLPFYLGGTVNLGVAKAAEVIRILSPKAVIRTHDERKRAKGLVSVLAKVQWCENVARALEPYSLSVKILEPVLGKEMEYNYGLQEEIKVPAIR